MIHLETYWKIEVPTNVSGVFFFKYGAGLVAMKWAHCRFVAIVKRVKRLFCLVIMSYNLLLDGVIYCFTNNNNNNTEFGRSNKISQDFCSVNENIFEEPDTTGLK